MKKSLWRGSFNFRQSCRVMYAYAYTEKQAWNVFCRRIAEKDGIAVSIVMGLFDGATDNFKIEEEPK